MANDCTNRLFIVGLGSNSGHIVQQVEIGWSMEIIPGLMAS